MRPHPEGGHFRETFRDTRRSARAPSTAIYFLLRQQVDATETDEVYIEDEEERFGLPPLEVDSAGVPQAADVDTQLGASDSVRLFAAA